MGGVLTQTHLYTVDLAHPPIPRRDVVVAEAQVGDDGALGRERDDQAMVEGEALGRVYMCSKKRGMGG